jgi:hypothetical protein
MRDSNTFDKLLQMKDAGAVTANGAGTVAAAAKVLSMGAAALGPAKAVIDISAATFAAHTYKLAVQGSADLAFTTPVELASTMAEALGRIELPFTNVKNEVTYPYIRVAHTVTGATPSINYTASMAKD